MSEPTPNPDPAVTPDQGTDFVELEKRTVSWWYPLLLLGALGLLFFIGHQMDLRGELGELRSWIDGLGMLGPVVFVALFVLLTVLGVPGSPLTAAAGALFGGIVGVVAALTAATLAMAASFLIARHLARDRMRRRLARNRTFRRIDRLVIRRPALVVATVRLLNLIPFPIVNYGFGLTRVPFTTYIVWSFVGKIPGTVVVVVGIDLIVEALRTNEVPWGPTILVILMAGGLALAIRRARRRFHELEEQVPDDDAAQNESPNIEPNAPQSADGP